MPSLHRLLALTMLLISFVACQEQSQPQSADSHDTADAAEGHLDQSGNPGHVAPKEITITEVTQLVPSSHLPASVQPQDANNNLDVVAHNDRVFFAFRSAPNHFASTETVMHVISGEDGLHFDRHELSIARATDLREPRFLSWRGTLFLYVAVLGTNPTAFEPQGTLVSRYEGPGQWSEPEPIFETGFIPWRTRILGGVPSLTGYVGGENIYENDGEGIIVTWLSSDDGLNWYPRVGDDGVVLRGGGSETDLTLLDDGTVIAVSRNEAGDETGWGSKICRGEAMNPTTWTCIADKRKYDSPLVFRHGTQVLLIGRRQVTETGFFDLEQSEGSHKEKTTAYQLEYWRTPKRCALWEIDPNSLEVSWLVDLPSRGDTCFASILPLDAHRYAVYNYTSPLDGPDLAWLDGQLGPTVIYRAVLSLP